MKHTIDSRLFGAALALAALLCGTGAYGQSINITGPASPVTVAAGHDFAVDVLADPWDLSQLRDIALDVGFHQPHLAGDVWNATSLEPAAYFFPLSPGFIRPNYDDYYALYDPGTPYGPLNPLDANTYDRVSMRLSLAQSERSLFTLFWTYDYSVWPSGAGNLVNFFDSDLTYNAQQQYVLVPRPSGFRVYDFDPTGVDWYEETEPDLVIPPSTLGQPWGGTMYGVQVWPSSEMNVGANVKVDWIRFYNSATSPTVDLTWTTQGIPSDPPGALATVSVEIFVDTDASGYDGDTLQSGVANDGRYTLRTAALPPGDYYFYMRVVKHENSGFTELARSGYSARVRIGHPPMVEITAPSYTSGVEYAATELNNAWDMSQSGDIASFSHISYPNFTDGLFIAMANAPEPGQIESDDQFVLNTRLNGQIVPIDTSFYRYLTFRVASDTQGYTNIFDRVRRGALSRITWWSSSLAADGAQSKAIPLLEGWHSYSVDLWDYDLVETEQIGLPQSAWTALPAVTGLRLDPLEAWIPTWFAVDYVKLCAVNAPQNNTYTIAWNAQDADSPLLDVALYYGVRDAAGNYSDVAQIATLSQAPGPNSYQWNTAGIIGIGEEYYIRVRVSDGATANSYVSRVPVMSAGIGPRSTTVPVSGDYNGDGLSDLAFYELATGDWYIRSGTTGPVIAFGLNWGFAGCTPVPGDYNGDGIDDLAVFHEATGNWYIRTLADGPAIAFGMPWGFQGCQPVSGDYDGDGVSDLAVFHEQSGFWYIRKIAPGPAIAFGLQWGFSGCDGVPGDYDGNGIDDLAVFHEQSGNWYIRKLAPGPAIAFGMTWGFNNCQPVQGDYDGDGIDDLAVFHPGSGNWYIRKIAPAPAIAFGLNWGVPNCIGVSGDYDADGRNDLGIYYIPQGTWYVLSLQTGRPIVFGQSWGYDPP